MPTLDSFAVRADKAAADNGARGVLVVEKIILIGAVVAAAMVIGTSAFAGAADYVFEPITAEIKKGNNVVVSVHLKHRATDKLVTDAIIVRTRIDMTPDGMGEMASPLTPVQADNPGVYSFKTELPMAGSWLLSISAKIQGERETVVGKVAFKASE